MLQVVVREHARLGTTPVTASLDQATVSASAFDWLCRESSRLRKSGAALVQIDDRRWLRLDNYVGVIQTPCGTRIEILPKHVDGAQDASSSRRLLRRMLARCLDLTPRESTPTDILAFDAPLSEWVMRQFLQALDRLVKRGLRFDYHAVQDEQRFLRGRLLVSRQLRQPPGRNHKFQIEHDLFDADRPENRLLRSALDRVAQSTGDAANWRLSHELATLLASIPPSSNVAQDFGRWRDDRLMAHYRSVRPWTALILNQQDPLSIVGEWHGMSLLFPMERLFERYVGACLRRQVPAGALVGPSQTEHLCVHRRAGWFRLKPDYQIRSGAHRWILDAKWKRVDERGTAASDYGLSQSDFYQMFAYGQRFIEGRGDLYLIYPRTTDFQQPLNVFAFSDELRLWVLPFDLDRETLACEPALLPFFYGPGQ